MKKVYLVLLSIVLLVSFAQAQFKLEITEQITAKTGGELEVIGKTFDEVWKGASRTLLLLKFQIKEQEKDSGWMVAYKKVGALTKIGNTGGDKIEVEDMPSWNLTIEENEEGKIVIFCIYNGGQGTIAVRGTRPFKKLCEKLETVLKDKKTAFLSE